MNNTPFFSIIIPVYNGLTHDLPACLNSIWNQSLDKELYEVICVDDCSTDGTRQWLKEQHKAHPNLRIIENQKNIRQGGARNRGVKVAKGKYILFIDQDDYFHKGGIDKVYEHLKENELDILVTDSAYQFKGYEHNNLQLNLEYTDVTDCEGYVKRNGWTIAPWRLCFNREFYNNTGVQFEENCRIEDVDWSVNLFFYAKRVQYQPILLIHYIKAESGTTDNMYRNKEILIANTMAGNRTLRLGYELYKNSAIKSNVIDLADSYYNYTCKYLFGLFCSLKGKKEIINLIEIKESKYRLVRYAIKYPTLYAIFTNCMVPLFRIARTIHRKRTAKRLQSQ
ncbi:MAG: glycosyltransferase [Bacteroidaceae bacterium]|nr:glycosyltransferase [Bacteroidaceae bacterium]